MNFIFIWCSRNSQFRKIFLLLYYGYVSSIFNLQFIHIDLVLLFKYMATVNLEVFICLWRIYLSANQLAFTEDPQSMCMFTNTKSVVHLILKNGTCKPWQTNSVMRIIMFPIPVLCKCSCHCVFWSPTHGSYAPVMTTIGSDPMHDWVFVVNAPNALVCYRITSLAKFVLWVLRLLAADMHSLWISDENKMQLRNSSL